MADTRIGSAAVSSMNTVVTDFSVDPKNTDGVSDQDETIWTNSKWQQYFGYYKTIPELKKAIDMKAIWTVGKGYEAEDDRTNVILSHISGWGTDTFNSILKNMIITRQIGGDAFAEIIRDNGTGILVNLKPLDPATIQIVVDKKGIIKEYRQVSKTGIRTKNLVFKPEEMFHLTKDRVADEIHGVSIIESIETTILARNEAIDDWRKVLHRNVYPVKIWSLDTDDENEINTFKAKVENTVKDKENIFLPKGTVEVEIPNVSLNSNLNAVSWIDNLRNQFYQVVGLPQIILGGSSDFTEASAKIAYLAFQQSVEDEQMDIESQIWQQLGLRIELTFPASLQNELLSDQSKDAQGQMELQPADFTAGVGR